MKISYYEAFDLIADEAVELLLAEEEKREREAGENKIQEIRQAEVNQEKNIRQRKGTKHHWKVRLLIAVIVILAMSSLSFAIRQRSFEQDGGAVLITDENRDFVGKARKAGSVTITDRYGNVISKGESLPNTVSPLVERTEKDAVISQTMEEFAVRTVDEKEITPEVMFTNGAMVIFTKENRKGWELKKGETLVFEAEEYPSEINSGKGQHIIYSYIVNGELRTDLGTNRKDLNQKYELTAKESGEYYICLIGGSSDTIALKQGTIYKK